MYHHQHVRHALVSRLHRRSDYSRLGPGHLHPLPEHQRRLLVAGALPVARHRDAHHWHQPDRRRDRTTLRAMTDAAIELQDLQIAYTVRGIDRRVLRGVSFSIGQGESYGLVGESGCGKTTAAFAIMRYLPRNAKILGGSIRLNGEDMLGMSGGSVRRVHAPKPSMGYQNPGSALNPSIRSGPQLAEVFALMGVEKDDAVHQSE